VDHFGVRDQTCHSTHFRFVAIFYYIHNPSIQLDNIELCGPVGKNLLVDYPVDYDDNIGDNSDLDIGLDD